MQRLLLTLLTCLVALVTTAQTSFRYSFRLDTSSTRPALVVDLRFRGNEAGVTHLQLPTEFAGQAQLYKAVADISILSKEATLSVPADSSLRILRHRPRAQVHIRYRLQQDWQGPLRTPQNNRAIIDPKYLHATGHALLVTPKQTDETWVTVQMDWSGLPAGWKVANSLVAAKRQHEARVRYGDLRNSLYVAGDYRLYRTGLNGRSVYLAIRGHNWQFTDSAALQATEQVLAVHRNFWNDHQDPYFLVALTPLAGTQSYNGSALHQAFLACLTTEDAIGGMFYWLLSHEYFHRWNGSLITLAGDERQNTWFTEGFTEYYAYNMLYRNGLMGQETYVQRTNQILRDYYLSPVRNHDKATLGRNFWSRREYQDIPYRKGFVYALYLNQLISTRSQGRYTLDNLMLALRQQVQQGQTPTDATLLSLLRTYTGEDLTAQHQQYINEGATIPVLPGSMGPEVTDTVQTFDAYDLGFDFDATVKKMELSGVVENSAAWRAGLRNGQKLKSGNVQYNNTAAPAVMRIEKDGQLTEIKYWPIADRQVPVPQFVVPKKPQTVQ